MRPHAVPARAARPAVLLSTAALAVTMAGCGSSDPAEPAAAPSPSAAADPVRIEDPWVKASDKGMTAAFGTLVNDTGTDATITAASTEVSPMELHGTAMKDGKMVMQLKKELVIKARSSHKLEPGGDHLMLMKLKRPVPAGEQLSFTLTFADGRTMAFTAVAKPFTGAREDYHPGASPAPGTSGTPTPMASHP